MNRSGVWRIRERGTDDTIAHVKLVVTETDPKELYIYYKAQGKGEWIEDADAYGFLLGQEGAVEEIT